MNVIEQYNAYSFLSFFAEFGGYLGLFLGLSIYHINYFIRQVIIYYTVINTTYLQLNLQFIILNNCFYACLLFLLKDEELNDHVS